VRFLHAQAQGLRRCGLVGVGLDPVDRQQAGQGQVFGAVHPGLQLGLPAAAGALLQHGQHIGFGHGATPAAQPQGAHDVIQGGAAFLAQLQVQAHGHQGALGVVADRGVGRVLVLAVVLHPGVEAGGGHALYLAARCLLHLVQGLGDQLEVGGGVDQAGAAQQQVVVVAGEAFEEPQQLGVVFLVVVVRHQFGRAQALDVPGVEVFMADQPQQLHIAIAGLVHADAWQVGAAADQGGGIAVFQAAIAVVCHIQHEHIAGMRGRAPEGNFGLANLLGVGQQALAIERCRGSRHDKAMGHAAGVEVAAPESPHLDGTVHQLVVVGSRVGAKAQLVYRHGGHAGGQLPVWRVG